VVKKEVKKSFKEEDGAERDLGGVIYVRRNGMWVKK
jgi:hypothetical protein